MVNSRAGLMDGDGAKRAEPPTWCKRRDHFSLRYMRCGTWPPRLCRTPGCVASAGSGRFFGAQLFCRPHLVNYVALRTAA